MYIDFLVSTAVMPLVICFYMLFRRMHNFENDLCTTVDAILEILGHKPKVAREQYETHQQLASPHQTTTTHHQPAHQPAHQAVHSHPGLIRPPVPAPPPPPGVRVPPRPPVRESSQLSQPRGRPPKPQRSTDSEYDSALGHV